MKFNKSETEVLNHVKNISSLKKCLKRHVTAFMKLKNMGICAVNGDNVWSFVLPNGTLIQNSKGYE